MRRRALKQPTLGELGQLVELLNGVLVGDHITLSQDGEFEVRDEDGARLFTLSAPMVAGLAALPFGMAASFVTKFLIERDAAYRAGRRAGVGEGMAHYREVVHDLLGVDRIVLALRDARPHR